MSAQSAKMKVRWSNCAKIANVLGVTKHFVHDKLYTKLLADPGVMSQLLSDAPSAELIASVKAWPEFQEQPLRVHEDSEELTHWQAVRVTVWFIEKVGGAARALELVKAVGKLEDS